MNRFDSNPDYQKYRRRVIEACVGLCGEHTRRFWEEDCEFVDEFLRAEDPDHVAEIQFRLTTGGHPR